MKRHRFDPISFIFGLIFLTIASVFALGEQSIDLDAWVLPGALMFLGVGLLVVTIRSLATSSDTKADQ